MTDYPYLYDHPIVGIDGEVTGAGGGGKGKGGGSSAAKEDPNTLQSRAIARIVDLLCEGQILGLVDGEKSIFFNGTPLEDAQGNRNFKGISFQMRLGLPSQTHLPGFSDVETDFAVATEVFNGIPVVRTISNTNAEAVRVTVRIPVLTKQDTKTGDLHGFEVRYQIHIQANGGGFVLVKDRTVNGKSVDPYEEAWRFSLTAQGSPPWDIRVTRITADSEKVTEQNDTFWARYTEIIEEKFEYPDSVVIGIEANSELFGGTIPSRSYELDGLLIKMPDNFDPATRTYNPPTWGGGFQTIWSDNPAWCLYDLLTNVRYGAGIPEVSLDKFAFFDIGKYCDEFIDDGAGSTEPRFKMNILINTRSEAFNLIQALVSVFRGMVYWAGGTIQVSNDQPLTPDAIVTQANVIGGEFRYEGTSFANRHNAILVSWNNPKENYRPIIEVVEDTRDIQKFGMKPSNVVAVGTTSRSQANRVGRWMLETEKSATELVTYLTGLDHLNIVPGQLARIFDPSHMGARFGGRLVLVSGVTVTLDAKVLFDADDTYSIEVILPDLTVESRNLVNPSGLLDVVTLSVAFSQLLNPGTLFGITGTNVVPRDFRIVAITENEKNIFEVVGLIHDDNKFARVEQNLKIETLVPTLFSSNEIAPPTLFTFKESLFKSNNKVGTRVDVSWTASPDTRVSMYQVDKKREDGNWEQVKITQFTTMEVDDLPPGIIEFRITALALLIGQSKPLESGKITLLGKTAPPGDVTNFVATEIVDGVVLTWTRVTDLDLVGYQIRQGGDWDTGIIVEELVIGTSSTVIIALGSGPVNFFIKSLDELEIFSDSAASVTVTAGVPNGVTGFIATAQEDHVRFDWDTVPGIDIIYEIRFGVTWADGQPIFRNKGDTATVLCPGVGLTTFWIKAFSPLGRSSVTEAFSTIPLVLFPDVNIVKDTDEALTNYAGTRITMELGPTDDDLVLQKIDGVPVTEGEYFFNVDLLQSFRARSWIEFKLLSYTEGQLTWASAGFNWLSGEADSSWLTTVDADGVEITPLISIDDGVLDADIIEAFTMNDTLLSVTSKSPVVDVNTSFLSARIGKGVLIAGNTKLEYDIVIPSEFTVQFRFIPTDDLSEQSHFMILQKIAGNVRLSIGLDRSLVQPVFFAVDDAGNRIEIDANFSTVKDFVVVILTQNATQWGLFAEAHVSGDVASKFENHSPVGTWDHVFVWAA